MDGEKYVDVSVFNNGDCLYLDKLDELCRCESSQLCSTLFHPVNGPGPAWHVAQGLKGDGGSQELLRVHAAKLHLRGRQQRSSAEWLHEEVYMRTNNPHSAPLTCMMFATASRL